MKIVIDVNAALYYVMQQDKAIEEILSECQSIIAPILFISEAGNALFQYTRKSIIDENLAIEYLSASTNIVDNFIDTTADKEDIFRLAYKHGLTYYDAEYLYLTLSSKHKLLTFDKKLKEVAERLKINI